MALTQKEKHDWMDRIRDVLRERKQRVLGDEPNILNTLKERAQEMANTELGIAAIVAKLDALQQRAKEAENRYNEEYQQVNDHATEIRAAIHRATESLEESLRGFGAKRDVLDAKNKENNELIQEDVQRLHTELDRILEVNTEDARYNYGRTEFALRREHSNIVSNCADIIRMKLIYDDPVASKTKILDDALFEFESALRLTTTTKQANIVWNDVQQFLVEFEESLENAQEESTEEGREAVTTDDNE
mgnify:CR=1 FL=1